VQPDGPTIQETLERALTTALREPIRVRGAGRTDAGVHAWGQIAAARLTNVPPDLDRLRRSLNALTPDDIAIRDLAIVDDAFDPRRDASSRVYEYRILTTDAPSVFWRRWSWHFSRPLDVDAMRTAARAFVGEHDFAAFCGADPAAPEDRSTVRRVIASDVHVEPPLLVYRVEATAFLKHMVRNLVGTLVEVGLGERPADDMSALLASRDRTRAGATAPAIGLVLREVRYEGRSSPVQPKS
jgi:tRNA pseudouridine38-40 synthase